LDFITFKDLKIIPYHYVQRIDEILNQFKLAATTATFIGQIRDKLILYVAVLGCCKGALLYGNQQATRDGELSIKSRIIEKVDSISGIILYIYI
jgi:hypothetical protein